MSNEELPSEKFERFLKSAKWPVNIYDSRDDAERGVAEFEKMVRNMKPMPMTQERVDFLMNAFYESRTDTAIIYALSDLTTFIGVPGMNFTETKYCLSKLNGFITVLMSKAIAEKASTINMLRLSIMLTEAVEEARKHWDIERLDFLSSNEDGSGDQIFIQNENSGCFVLAKGTTKLDISPDISKAYRLFSPGQFIQFVDACKKANEWNLFPSEIETKRLG